MGRDMDFQFHGMICDVTRKTPIMRARCDVTGSPYGQSAVAFSEAPDGRFTVAGTFYVADEEAGETPNQVVLTIHRPGYVTPPPLQLGTVGQVLQHGLSSDEIFWMQPIA